jgi:predicted Rossmann fold nucleotide-binding protein DprA/Smf involved in DNA uptake
MANEKPTQQIHELSIDSIPAFVQHREHFPIIYVEGNTERKYASLPDFVQVRGDVELLNENVTRIAIVGTREPQIEQVRTSGQMGRFLADNNIVVVSGLAPGIDAQSHMTASKGVAVLPSALDDGNITPRINESLAMRLLSKGGLLLSENNTAFTHNPDYVQRNRLICAISDIVIIVAATANRGTSHTARVAWALGQPLGVIDPNSFPDNIRDDRTFDLNRQLLGLIGTKNQRGIFRITVNPDLDYQENQQIWQAQILGRDIES